MDAQRLKDLLDQAGREYNEGRYAEAIAHWQEVLADDPDNQKAKEGIRMAQLLVVNWETAEGEGEELSLAAGGLDPETEEKIRFGIGRVRELMAAGRLEEAIEGCQLLSELAPSMDSVRMLKEEVSQALETQAFARDRIERARRHLAQGKNAEAAEEARNVLLVDKANRDAQSILQQAGGVPSEEPARKGPSAFETGEGKPAPPSPFAARAVEDLFDASADEPLPRPQAGPQPPSPPGPLDIVFEDQPAPPAAGSAGIGALIEQGEKLFQNRRYQDAIDVWSRVFVTDPSNAEAERLIDDAKVRLEEIGRQSDEAYFRGVDFFEAGSFKEARRAFEEVLLAQPGHNDARDYLARIDKAEKEDRQAANAPRPGIGEEAESVPLAPPVAAAKPAPSRPPAEKAPSVGHPGLLPPPVSAGLPRKKPVVAAPPASRTRVVAAAAIVVVLALIGSGAAYLLLGGSAAPDPLPPAAAPPSVAQAVLPGAPAAEGEASAPRPTAPTQAAAASPASSGLEIVPGAPKNPAPSAPDPAAIRRKVDQHLREARGLLGEQRWQEAIAALDQALALDPANFDAEDLRLKAVEGATAQAKFSKELEAAKAAFQDGDWGGALYKLYRLREERKEMAALKTYIENANYNWGIEALQNFELEAAQEHFKDALEMDPDDPAIPRHVDVAKRYRRRPRDAAYEAYVSKLQPRSLDAR